MNPAAGPTTTTQEAEQPDRADALDLLWRYGQVQQAVDSFTRAYNHLGAEGFAIDKEVSSALLQAALQAWAESAAAVRTLVQEPGPEPVEHLPGPDLRGALKLLGVAGRPPERQPEPA